MTVARPPRGRSLRERLPVPTVVPRARDVAQRPAPRQRLRALRMSDAWFSMFVVAWGMLIALLAVGEQWQALATVVWVPGFAMLFVQWPKIGTALLFTLWVFAPFVRRILDLVSPAMLGPDILSLTPFMATGAMAILAYRKYKPPRAVNLFFFAILLGFGIGVPTGFSAPLAVMFGMFAYISAVLGLYIGYANGRERLFTFEELLMPLILVCSIYAVYQGLTPRLPIWDQTWLLTTRFVSVGSKELGTFRSFSFLNAPYTYASLVAVYLAVLFVSRRLTLVRLITVIAAIMGIFATQSRGAWVSVVGGLVIITAFTGGRALPRLIGLALTLVGMYVALGSTPAGQAVTARATSITEGSADKSGGDRLDAITQWGPPSLARPLGAGIGSVGAASDLNPTPTYSLVDNGFLIMLVMVGPIGFILVGIGIGGLIWLTMRGTTIDERKLLLPLLAPVGVYVPLTVFSETLYGLTGFVLFYALGEALGRRYQGPGTVDARAAAAQLDAAPVAHKV